MREQDPGRTAPPRVHRGVWLAGILAVAAVLLGAGLAGGPGVDAQGATAGPAATFQAEQAQEGEAAPFDFQKLFKKKVDPEPVRHVLGLPVYTRQTFQILAVLLIILVFGWVRLAQRPGARPGLIPRIFSGWVLWIRDEMVYPVLGREDGARFLPYFLFVFFFIAFMNLLGLVPHGYTATASIFVTAALAGTTFAMMIGSGMVRQGPVAFWKHLVPPGIPLLMWPLMAVVEFIGLLVKPFALTIRLFANMMAGHLVVLSFLGLIFYFAGMLGALAYAVAPAAVGLGAFIVIIKAFVSLLQAYIFTYLSILFVGASLHPHH